MKFLALLTVLASVMLTLAKPVQKREIGGILICNGPDSTGPCTYQVYQLETCHNLTAPFLRNASTFAPDGENFYCYPYGYECGTVICTSPEGCTLGAIDFNYEHKYNLSAVSWDKSIASFECYLNSTAAPTT